MKQRYKKTIKFNAQHNTGGISHPHTFTVTLYIISEKPILFYEQESIINNYFEKLRGKYLNAIFNEENLTLERMGEIFFLSIRNLLSGTSFNLETVEIGDSPTKTIIISDYYRVGSARLLILGKELS